MVNSRITGRTHHYLSRQEFKVHLLAEYEPSTTDIREQFALLPWEETRELALDLGIRHPVYPGTSTPTVLTTDLLLTMSRADGAELIAISVKIKKDLNARALEKLLLERTYWNKRGVTWILATDENIPNIRVKNLEFFESALSDDRGLKSRIDPVYFSRKFEENHSSALSFNDIMTTTTSALNIDSHIGHSLLGMAVWDHKSRLNIDDLALTHRGPVLLLNEGE
jgi:hypothetical protein